MKELMLGNAAVARGSMRLDANSSPATPEPLRPKSPKRLLNSLKSTANGHPMKRSPSNPLMAQASPVYGAAVR